MKKLDQYSPPTYNVSSVGYTNNSDEQLTLDYVPISEDGFQNFGRDENIENLTSSIQYIPAMNIDDSSNFITTDYGEDQSPGKPLRFRRQMKLKSDQPIVDNFSKQSHLFFVPSMGSSSAYEPSEDNLNVSLGYSVPEFIPNSNPQQHETLPNQSSFPSVYESGMTSKTSFVQNNTPSGAFEPISHFSSHPASDQNQPNPQKESKPVFSKPKKSICGALSKYIIVLIGLVILGSMIYGCVRLWENSNAVLQSSHSETSTQRHEKTNILEEEVIVDKEEPIQKKIDPQTESSLPTPTETNPIEPISQPSTLTDGSSKENTEQNNDPFHFFDPFTENSQKKASKKQENPKKRKKIQIPQEIYDRVYPKRKKSASNESKFNFMDKKIEKYLDNLSKKDYGKLSNADKKLIKEYIHLRESESFEQLTKTSSSKYKRKGIRKKKVKTNPYEFDYAKSDDNEEMQISSDPMLPVKTVRDKKGRMHHIDPFGVNEHENDESYDEDVKNYLKNPDYGKYLDKVSQEEDEEDDDDY